MLALITKSYEKNCIKYQELDSVFEYTYNSILKSFSFLYSNVYLV